MKKMLAVILSVAMVTGMAMTANEAEAQEQQRSLDRSQGRSMVITKYGVVAAESTLAAQAGAQILAKGGSAADAAVAANAVMGLVAPMSNGIGGDLFAIVYEAKSGKLKGLNASGWAPAALTSELLKSKGIRKKEKKTGSPRKFSCAAIC